MSKTKAQSSNRLVKVGKFKFDKAFLIVTAAVVVATGGYLFYRGTHAAIPPKPPISWLGSKEMYFKTTDGVQTDGITIFARCSNVEESTPYGMAVRCYQLKGNNTTTSYRDVIYNLSAKTFSPNGSWITYNSNNPGGTFDVGSYWPICVNGLHPFTALGSAYTANGWRYYGQEFNLSVYGVWQTRFSTATSYTRSPYDPSYNGCSPSTSWMNVIGTWQ